MIYQVNALDTTEQPSKSATRRLWLTGVAVALLLVGTVLFIVDRSNRQADKIDQGVIDVSYPILLPELCRSLVEADAGNRTAAYNAFYQKAHSALHVLRADVDDRGSRGQQISTALLRSKSKVESGMVSFPASLIDDIADLIAVTGDALVEVGFEGESTC
jgi:hypothetical protein